MKNENPNNAAPVVEGLNKMNRTKTQLIRVEEPVHMNCLW